MIGSLEKLHALYGEPKTTATVGPEGPDCSPRGDAYDGAWPETAAAALW